MAPKNKFTKEEMVAAALRVVREKGIDGLTAKTMADALGTSTQPVFTCIGSMDGVRQEVYAAALRVYKGYAGVGCRRKYRFSASVCSISASRGRNRSCTGSCS